MTFYAPAPPEGYAVRNLDRWRIWAKLTMIPVPDWEKEFQAFDSKKLRDMGISRQSADDDFFDSEPDMVIDAPCMVANFWVSELQKDAGYEPWYSINRLDLATQRRSRCLIKRKGPTAWEPRSIFVARGEAMTLPYDTPPEEVVRLWKQTRKAA